VQRLIGIISEAQGVILATPCYGFDVPAQLKAYIERSELKEFDGKTVGIVALASLGGIHMVSTITSNLIHNSHPIIAGWAIVTRFYPKRGQAIKDDNSKKSVERLAEQMYSTLRGKGDWNTDQST
jgi:multimeric flavodoxin WrbA